MSIFYTLINLIYPAQCIVCGKKINEWNNGICNDCIKKIKKRLPPFCARCGRHLPEGPETYPLCVECRNNLFYFDRAVSVFYYEGVLRQLIHNFKYNKMISLSTYFSSCMVDFMKDYHVGNSCQIVTSVPMHPFRLLTREFNIPDILARKIAKELGLEYCRLLKKIKNTVPQSMLDRTQRLKNVKGTFSINKNKINKIKNKDILLVDDLFTTGSTANECARILKAGGANRVEVITLACADKPI